METQNNLITQADIAPVRTRFLALTNDEKVFAREASFACQLMNGNSYLAKASVASLQMAVLNVAQLGLSLNPALKLAYLVPRWSKKTGGVEVALEASYQGLVKLLTDCGTVTQVEARIIWEGDVVDIDIAYPEKVRSHKPYVLTGKQKGAMLGVYSLATLHDGTRSIELMSQEEVHEIRERSESWKRAKEAEAQGKPPVSSIWATDEAEMWRKTVIRRHFKYLPKSGNAEKVAKVSEAIELDNGDFEMSFDQYTMIERLLGTALISEDKRTQIESELIGMSRAQASKTISWLKDQQPADVPKELGREARREAAQA